MIVLRSRLMSRKRRRLRMPKPLTPQDWKELWESPNKDICHFCKKDLGEDGTAVEEVNVCWDCADEREEFIWEG